MVLPYAVFHLFPDPLSTVPIEDGHSLFSWLFRDLKAAAGSLPLRKNITGFSRRKIQSFQTSGNVCPEFQTCYRETAVLSFSMDLGKGPGQREGGSLGPLDCRHITDM